MGGGLTLRLKLLLLFAALIAAAGSLLAWWNYRQLEAAALTEADAVVARAAAGIESDLRDYTATTALGLHLLRTADFVIDRAQWAAPRAARSLLAQLDPNGGIPAVYAGYPDGRFILARPLATADDRERFDAPHDARFVLQRIATPGKPGSFIYLDRSGNEIARSARPDYRYDPRTRPWFRAAVDAAAVLTPVYRFATSKLMGYTVALRAPNGAVVAADVDLGSLSARLRALLPTPRSIATIVDPGAVVVAASNDATRPSALLRAALAHPGAPYVDLAGERWRSYLAPVGSSARGVRTLAVLVPESDLLADAYRVREQALIAAAVLLLLYVPVIWWAAGLVAKPLQQLRREAATLLALDFSPRPWHRFHVLEVAHLSDAFDAVRERLRRYLALSGQLASERDLTRILETMLAEVVDAAHAAGGALALTQDGEVRSCTTHAGVVPPEAFEPGGLAYLALKTHAPAQGPIDDAGTEGLAVPLRARAGGSWGAAIVVRTAADRTPFSPSSRAYAAAIADSAAVAIEAQGTIAALERYAGAADRFVPHEFAAQLGRDDIRALQLGDHVSRRMIVMFVHLHGVKAAAAKTGPDEGFAILERFFGCIGPIVRDRDGFVDKYVGDMAMALFPYRPDAPVDAALEILAALRADCAAWAQRYGEHFSIAAGMHGGGLMLGTIGEERRFETTVIADVVNIASRISSLTQQFGAPLLVSGDIGAELRLERRRRLAEVAVKGARRPIMIEEIYAADDEPLARAKDAAAERFDTARRLYAAGDFAAAQATFARIAADEPLDLPAAFFRDRCATAIPLHWDGVVRLTSK